MAFSYTIFKHQITVVVVAEEFKHLKC